MSPNESRRGPIEAQKSHVMKALGTFMMSFLIALSCIAGARPALAGETMEIRLIVDGEALPAILEDNPTSRDLASMLPLTIRMSDYNRTEKTGKLPRALSTEGAPDGFDPSVGDIALYAPWGTLVLYYRDFVWSRGLIPLGRISSGVDRLAAQSGDFDVTFERAR